MYTLLVTFYLNGILYNYVEKTNLTKQECVAYLSRPYLDYPMNSATLNCVESYTLK